MGAMENRRQGLCEACAVVGLDMAVIFDYLVKYGLCGICIIIHCDIMQYLGNTVQREALCESLALMCSDVM